MTVLRFEETDITDGAISAGVWVDGTYIGVVYMNLHTWTILREIGEDHRHDKVSVLTKVEADDMRNAK